MKKHIPEIKGFSHHSPSPKSKRLALLKDTEGFKDIY